MKKKTNDNIKKTYEFIKKKVNPNNFPLDGSSDQENKKKLVKLVKFSVLSIVKMRVPRPT